MAGEEGAEIGGRPKAQVSARHEDRTTPEQVLKTRLIQVINAYSTNNGKTGDQGIALAIDLLVKHKQGFS